ncbi:SusC/RagA family TonB-linked outer membrane protein [Sunxiuqinia indica]|uniref:SusC/RagA family TonB-linked outer membrane protein n=1 Tax=Sunxiuqinia indica TaxID=2692584 RepID=UPI0013581A3D|nr:SusC/RagA family TonB-linked outer membrane protein [Sunxiuqinia indica]
MRLTVFLIVLLSLQTIAKSNFAQTQKVELKIENATISEVLDRLEDETNYFFFYNNKTVSLDKKVSLDVENKSIEEVLNLLFKGSEVTYTINNRQIILSGKGGSFSQLMQQPSNVSGKVTDASGMPLPGVTIVIKGTTIGAITDMDGNYELGNLSENAVLVFSFVGMRAQEVPVDRAIINVTLDEETIGLEEVVAVGYGTMKKADVTSSVGTVKSEDFNVGSVQDAGQLIQGKVAGLSLNTTSGDPTAGTSIRLRGNTTLFGTSTNPLILVDGVPSDLGTVAPEDIESIDVLKDGSAAAIYGTRGTNGVILITTRRASADPQAHVEYTGYVSTQAIANKLDMLTAEDYRQQVADGIRPQSDELGASTDWLDEITRTPVNYIHNLTFRGGNAKTNYLATINYRDTEGIFLESYSERLTARADINHSMFEDMLNFNLGILTKAEKMNSYNAERGFNGYTYRQALIYNPTSPIKNENGDWVEQPGAFNYDNPLSRIEESDGETSTNLTRVTGTVTLKPVKGLTLKSLVSFSKWNQTIGYYETKNHISTVRSGVNGFASNNANENTEKLIDLTSEYKKNIGDHNFTFLAGYSWQDFVGRDFYVNNNDFPTDLFGYNNIGLGTGIKNGSTSWGVGSGKTKTNLIGFFGRFNYNYKNRYLLMASVRHEAASQLYGTNSPWGTFPAVSVGWRLTEEPFLKNVGLLNDLKLRAGYGVTGTQPSNLFLGVGTLSYGSAFYTDGKWIQTLTPGRNPNPYLKWEEKKETNIGLDFAMLGNRLSGSIDVYSRKIDGLLYDYAVPTPPNLVNTTRANVGVMENQGLEVLINAIPVTNKDFEWSTNVTFSTNSNKLISLSNELYQATSDYFIPDYFATGEPIQTYTHKVDIGEEIGNFFGFKVIDVDDEGKWIYEDAEGNAVPYAEFDHSFENKHVLGNGIPKFIGSWNNTLRYKNLDFSVTMRGAFDFQILNFERMYLENTKTVQYNRLQSAYDPVFGKAVLSDEMDLEFNSYYIEDGDYWKIDNITLGYTFKSFNQYIRQARIYASTLNTFVFTNYKGIDPEVYSGGLMPGNDGRDKYPTTRTFTLGVNLTF